MSTCVFLVVRHDPCDREGWGEPLRAFTSWDDAREWAESAYDEAFGEGAYALASANGSDDFERHFELAPVDLD